MNISIYDEVVNGDNTYNEIATKLKNGTSCLIGWTDELCTHLDILFTMNVEKVGYIQRGIKANYLFVNIIDHTSYGFRPDDEKHPNYIKEKLRLGDNECSDKIAELINGVIRCLNTNK